MNWLIGSNGTSGEVQIEECKVNTDNMYLKKSNYLSEFTTQEEKRKARENLGINSYINWGINRWILRIVGGLI